METLVWIDETGLDEALQREYGYALAGKVSSKRFVERHSVIAGLSGGKALAPWGFNGYCDTEVVLTWVKPVLAPELKPGLTVIMDNASFHKAPAIRQAIEAAGCQLLFLPPYSPDLNPIEKFWAKVKAWLRKMACPLIPLLKLVDAFFQKSN